MQQEDERKNLYAAVNFLIADFLKDHTSGDDILCITRLHVNEESAVAVDQIATLLATVRKVLTGRRPDFFTRGPIAVPTTPNGVKVLRLLVDHSDEILHGPLTAPLISEGSNAHRLLVALDTARSGSGVIGGVRNTSTEETRGLRLNVHLASAIMANLPAGTINPPSLLLPSLIGREVTDVEDLRETTGMCLEGVRDFLNRFGISHSTEGGDYECGECGTLQENCYDESRIDYAETFELTKEMIAAIDSAGYLDEVRDYLGSPEGSAESWRELLASDTAANLLAKLKPTDELHGCGARFDVKLWTFAPDYEALDGLEDVEFSELAELLPLLTKVTESYLAEGLLPPVPGTLKAVGHACVPTRPGAVAWSWDPADGILRHRGLEWTPVADRLRFLVDDRYVPVGSDGSIACPVYEAGPDAELYCGIAQGQLKA